jgi:Tfp pilus assembly protein PilF
MEVGQQHAPTIPFWCKIVVTCCILAMLSSCAGRNEEAARHAILAQQALNGKNLAAARAEIAAAIADRDDIAEYHVLRGRIELAAGSQSAAFNAYDNALALDATNAEALLAVAQLGLTTGNVQDSFEATERFLALAPTNPDALLVRGIHSIIRRNYTEAIQFADKILADDPDNEGGLILKARALFMLRRPEDALATVEKISSGETDSIPAALTRLEIYRAQGQASKMIPEFELLRKLRPDDLPLRIDEANLRLKLGQRAQGDRLVEDVLADPQAGRDVADQAIALWREYGDPKLSENDLETIARTGSIVSRTALSRFLLERGRAASAARIISRLPASFSRGLEARLLILSGKGEAAQRVAADVLDQDNTNCDALIAASGGALQHRQADDALRFAQQAASECPSLPSGWLLAANAYEALGRESGVNRVYGQALDANKQSSLLTRAYADWLVSQKRTREALAMARRLTRYAPALLSAWQLYGDLCRRFDNSCLAEASGGLARARTLLGIDLPPGTLPPNGLFGRFVEQ